MRGASDFVTLMCPPGAFDYPIALGCQEFYPYRLDHEDDSGLEFGGPWAVDVPIDVARHFMGVGGFTLMATDMKVPTGMVRLRKTDGGHASFSHDSVTYEPGEDGTVIAPASAVGILTESHGFELVMDEIPEPTRVRRAQKI